MSLVVDRAKWESHLRLPTLLVFGLDHIVRYSFQDLSFGKDSYRDGVIGKKNVPQALRRHHLQYFVIVLEADAGVS